MSAGLRSWAQLRIPILAADMEVTQFFIVAIGWIIFPASAVALLLANFFLFRKDVSAFPWSDKHPTSLWR